MYYFMCVISNSHYVLLLFHFQFSTALATYDTLYLFLIKVQYNVHSFFLIVIGKVYVRECFYDVGKMDYVG